MANNGGGGEAVIRVKATVNKEKTSVVFVEADAELADVLLSYLTLPIASIINLSRKHPPAVSLGCFDNLYRSVESVELNHFKTPRCKEMLLCPRNGAAVYCQYLKFNIEEEGPTKKKPCFFRCSIPYTGCGQMLYSYEKNDVCECGKEMTYEYPLRCPDVLENCLFVKRLGRLLISDDLQVKPASTAATLSFLTDHSFRDATAVEELSFDFGFNEALDLLKQSLVSNTALSDVLLKPKKELTVKAGIAVVVKQEENASKVAAAAADPVAHIKLVYCKTKKRVLYAEASDTFVDLLFSFLVVPLGHVFKQMFEDVAGGGGGNVMNPLKGCLQHTYKSLEGLVAEQYIARPLVLQNPRLAAGYGYRKHPLGIEEIKYFARYSNDSVVIHPAEAETELVGGCFNLRQPKFPARIATSVCDGYLSPSMWTITDDLNVSPISPASLLRILRTLNVSFSELEDRTVHVGKQEVSRLLVASLYSATPLTDVFFDQLN